VARSWSDEPVLETVRQIYSGRSCVGDADSVVRIGGRAQWRHLSAVLLALTGVVSLAWAYTAAGRLNAAAPAAVVAGVLLTGLGTALGYQTIRRTSPTDPVKQLEYVRDELARQVDRQWRREARIRGLSQPHPLRVRWSATGRPGAVAANDAVDEVAGLKPDGDLSGVADAWRALPARQLVVTGAAGAGKTSLAVLFTLGLLGESRPGEPVPVLLNLSGWDPSYEYVDDWLVRRLAELYPWLRDSWRFGRDAALRLVDRSLIVPVLDGLDELPEPLRGAVVTALAAAVEQDWPLVVTCRTNEYDETIAASDSTLARAAVVEIEPVNAREIGEYLYAGQTAGESRWAGVVAHLAAHSEGALAKALSTPLMVYLARTVYAPPETDPIELTRISEQADIEKHLLRGYLPALYGPHMPDPDRHGSAPLHHYPTDKVRRWLAYLAHLLERQQTRELHWWRLIPTDPLYRGATSLGVAGLGLLVCMLGIAILSGPRSAVAFGFSVGFTGLTFMFYAAGTEPKPHRINLSPGYLRFWVALSAAVVVISGSVQASVILLEPGQVPDVETYIGILLRVATLAFVTLGVLYQTARIAAGRGFSDPIRSLFDNRNRFLVLWFGLALILAVGGPVLFARDQVAPTISLYGFGSLLSLVAIIAPTNAWFAFGLVRFWRTRQGLLPWHVMHFLHDANRRGVLTQVGTAYQFRHARVQDYLADLVIRSPHRAV